MYLPSSDRVILSVIPSNVSRIEEILADSLCNLFKTSWASLPVNLIILPVSLYFERSPLCIVFGLISLLIADSVNTLVVYATLCEGNTTWSHVITLIPLTYALPPTFSIAPKARRENAGFAPVRNSWSKNSPYSLRVPW